MKAGQSVLQASELVEPWTPEAAAELYDIDRWGQGYFRVGSNGHVWVHPTKDPAYGIDLKKLVDSLLLRGISLPILIRFGEILQHRLGEIYEAFERAIREQGYQGTYRCAYPVKVNPQRHVVEELLRRRGPGGIGLEAGSKPELLAVIALAGDETPILCNGFKDREYIELVMLAKKVGRDIVPVVEKFSELDLILQVAREVGVEPVIGARVKLATEGAGRWKASAGQRSKFGLTTAELLRLLGRLRAQGLEHTLRVLHFHLGSQVTNIHVLKAAVTEAARVYVELKRAGAGLEYLDVGGGLGVDYDGSQSDVQSSVNYTLQEYANDVVHHIRTVCDAGGVPHPVIVSETGRAIAAYHSVLVFDVVGVAGLGEVELPSEIPAHWQRPVHDLFETYRDLNINNLLESYHDAQQSLEAALHLFSLGYLTLEERAAAENLYWAICRKIQRLAAQQGDLPEELRGLESQLSDIYYCNFSLFQSMPDSWAIGQLFPIMPIHRLDERPTQYAMLADISCDSDGKVDRFIGRKQIRHALPVHPVNSRPYLLAAFLVGAYQEILGDLHNLFGDTHAVHVRGSPGEEPVLEYVIRGDAVREVLGYMQYQAPELIERLRQDVEAAVRVGRLSYRDSGRILRLYEESLRGYTYLE